jgi:homoserine kinase
MVRVRVPASASNLGPGFDCLGLALDLQLEVEAELVPRGLEIELEGEGAAQLPRDATNLVHACARRVLRRAGCEPVGLRLRLRNPIPLGRGLGSSAAATVAGLIAGSLLARPSEPDRAQVLELATEIEGHPDNAAPALFGGLVAGCVDAGRVFTVGFSFPADLEVLLVVPEIEVATEHARKVLPRQVPLEDAVFGLQRLALLLGALASRDGEHLRVAMQDRLHEPVRLGLVPGLAEALDALRTDRAAFGAALSGSGPTLVGFVRRGVPDAGRTAVEILNRHGVAAVVRRVDVSPHGASWSRS